MNKAELVKRVADRMRVSQKMASQFVEIFKETLEEAIKEDGSMTLQGFGTFTHWAQTERLGRNPKTGTSVTIPARSSIKFKPGKDLLKFLNE
ncbi:HU family DNA-binding protein [Parabacteroides sp.]